MHINATQWFVRLKVNISQMADVSISPSSLLCSVLLLGVAAIGVVAYSLVKSYINNKSNAESLAENVLIKYFCNFATSMICVYLVRFLIWVAFALKPPLLQYLGQCTRQPVCLKFIHWQL